MTIAYKATAFWLCIPRGSIKTGIKSDGEEGPEDGINHLHPEHVFNHDLHSRGFPGFHFH